MTQRFSAKTKLLRSCANAALLAGAAFASSQAAAQGIQADGTVVQGSAQIDDTVPNVTRITVDTQDTVIDWTPNIDPSTLDADTFLPFGNTAIFQNGVNNTDFAVLNRILPDANNNPVLFEGLVQSFITDFAGVTNPGGFVAFYSPSGIIVGPTGRFEVPQLMLTTQAVDITTIQPFVTGTGSGQMFLSGATGSIDLQAGSSFVGTPEDSFLVVASPQITMSGDAFYNGSIAYVASTSVLLRHSSGLFDIIITGGVGGGQVINHSGSSGGPSSTGAGDEHVVYGVTQGAFGGGPVSMLFSGNLGFQPAASATVVNGDIILSANYNVFGRTVDGDNNRQGADSLFDGRSSTPGVRGDILLSGIDATSNFLAISTHQTNLDATSSSSSFAADLSLVGREQATVAVGSGPQVTVGGDLFVSARNYGQITQALSEVNATGGFASILAEIDGLVQVLGETMVTASAIPGFDLINGTIGNGQGGQAQILAQGGLIDLRGNVRMESYAETDLTPFAVGIPAFAGTGNMQGGTVQFLATEDGALSTLGNLSIDASARTPILDVLNAAATGSATGGDILIGAGTNGGGVSVGGNVQANADGDVSAIALPAGTVAGATGGSVSLQALPFGGLDLQGNVSLSAEGRSDDVTGGGDAGPATGGSVSVSLTDSFADIAGSLALDSSATGGAGQNGGAATGGSSTVLLSNTLLTIGGSLSFDTEAFAGDTNGTGAGGTAAAGDVDIQLGANGQLVVNGALASIINSGATGGDGDDGAGGNASGGDLLITVDGAGAAATFAGDLDIRGFASGGDSSASAGGNANGSLVQISALNGGALSIAATLVHGAQAQAGAGATGGSANGGNASLASGALASISLGNYTGAVDAIGGLGLTGDGGSASGGNLSFDITNGTITVTGPTFTVSAIGTGGNSQNATGGSGTGGTAQIQLDGGTLVAATATLSGTANGIGGETFGAGTQSGEGTGGTATLSGINGADITLGGLSLAANGSGGGSLVDVIGANGTGGDATVAVAGDGTFLSLGGPALLSATGTGGGSTSAGSTGATGEGGTALFISTDLAFVQSTSTITANANGAGGAGVATGGEGIGGVASIEVDLGATIGATGLAVTADGTGATGATGGGAAGGQAGLLASDGSLTATGSMLASANGTGGTGTLISGGEALGGEVSLAILTGGVVTAGADMTIEASATGGEGVGSADGGNATGGSVSAIIEGGSLTGITSALSLITDGTGGTTASVAALSGSGTGGDASLGILDGGTATLAGLLVSGTGTGGDAQGGSAALDISVAGSSLIVSDSFLIRANATGSDSLGGAGLGGTATGGTASFSISSDAAVDITGATTAAVESLAVGGNSEVDGGAGGDASSGDVTFAASGGASLTGDLLQLTSSATGGSEASGIGISGGDATSGAVTANVVGSTFSSSVIATSSATGGTSGNAAGGAATSGNTSFNANVATVNLGATSVITSQATGGNGTTGGDAIGGNALLSNGGDLVGGELVISSLATGGNGNTGGDATAGTARLFNTSTTAFVDLLSLTLITRAEGSMGATANSGSAELENDLGIITSPLITLTADAVGDANTTPGLAIVLNAGGNIEAATLAISALGSNPGPEAQVTSNGGDINIIDLFDADVTGDILLSYLNGGTLVGGANPADLSALFDVDAGGFITVDGDDSLNRGVTALDLLLTSSNIDILADTLIGAENSVTLTSTNTADAALLGGAIDGSGYSLQADEAARIEGTFLAIILPDIFGTDIDASIEDLSLNGSLGGGFSGIEIDVDGNLDIVGAFAVNSADATDTLAITTTGRIQITLPTGSVQMFNSTEPGGILTLTAPDIIAADAALIAQILADPTDPAIADALLDDGGATSITDYIVGNRVELIGDNVVYTQNTGANDVFGGILSGTGGILIRQSSDQIPNDMLTIAFGRGGFDAGGNQLTNDDYFFAAEFNQTPANHFPDDATLNNCLIVAMTCPTVTTPPTPTDPTEPTIPPINEILIREPVEPKDVTEEGATIDSEFGFDFPGLIDAPLISEEEVVREPVTSGNDSAVTALGAPAIDEEEGEE